MAQYFFAPEDGDNGSTPSNAVLTQPWSAPSFSSISVTTGFTPTAVQFTPQASTITNALAGFSQIEGADTSAITATEVYAFVVPNGSANSWFVAASCTGSGFSNANGYYGGINRATDQMEIWKVSAGSRSLLASAADSGDFRSVHILFKITESGGDVVLDLFVWDDGGSEPGTPTVSYTDTSPLGTLAGLTGMAQVNRSTSFSPRLNVFGVGTGGDPAPRSAASSTPVSFTGTVPTQNLTEDVAMTSLDLTSYFSGSETPFTYAIQSGTLPTGLSLSSGVISGTPTQVGTFPIVVRGTDQGSDTADTNSFNIVVASAVATVTVTDPLKNNTGTLWASETGIKASVLNATTLESVYEVTGLTTNGSGVLEAISNAALNAGDSYHVAIKLSDGSVGVTGPITAT